MRAEPFSLEVACYSGHRGEQTPRRFTLAAVERRVVEVLDCWLGPDHRYFKVLADDGGTYILRHDAAADRWELTLFDGRGRSRPPRQPDPAGSGTGDD